MTSHDPEDALKDLFDRTLKALPLRSAPPTLESRVLGELERRAALAWWRRSFTHWPLAARAVFLVICLALIRLAFVGGATAVAGVRSLSWARDMGLRVTAAGNLLSLLANMAPPTWFYQGIAAAAVLYAILFGLGAAVYRTLYLQPHSGR